ncbi:MAG: ferrous iron transport protein A [Lachnospiraceae bacterium]|nr:ferrous iron transport protein A [Lachnospiraceae bacterium]
MALAMASIGEKRVITKLHGKDDIIRHLQDLGFTPGSEVQVLGQNLAGMILMVKGVRVALSRGLANKIMVD